jgi:FixJ family two-component response regulator
MNEEVFTVYIVDDDASVRRALSRLIRSAGYTAMPFACAREFLDAFNDSHGAACLVLDVGMPDINGLDLQRQLNGTHDAIPIVFLTGRGDIAMTVGAMKAGATDFLTKPVNDTALLDAIKSAFRRAAEIAATRMELASITTRMARLTPREREVLSLLLGGRVNKQAAGELGITEKTIKVHRARVMEKMEARSMVELARCVDKVVSPQAPHPFA